MRRDAASEAYSYTEAAGPVSAHAGVGIGRAIARDLNRYGSARAEINRPGCPRWADHPVWVSPAWGFWAEIFELGDRVVAHDWDQS